MIDHENYIFKVVASKLREEYDVDNIYIIGEELSNTPSKFPAVSIIQSDNLINTQYCTLENSENVAIESYKVEVVSNYEKEECKKIISIVNDVFNDIGYLRTFNQSVKSADSTLYRRIARFKNSNSIGGK